MCGIFFLTGLYICLSFLKFSSFTILPEMQFLLWKVSRIYMFGDLIFMSIQKLLKQKVRPDLLLHHSMALIGLELCKYYNKYFIWSLVSISEILSIWTGVGTYALYTKDYFLAKIVYILRAFTLLFIRIPWWILGIYHIGYLHNKVLYWLYLIGLKLILCLDFYWLYECIKKAVLFHLIQCIY